MKRFLHTLCMALYICSIIAFIIIILVGCKSSKNTTTDQYIVNQEGNYNEVSTELLISDLNVKAWYSQNIKRKISFRIYDTNKVDSTGNCLLLADGNIDEEVKEDGGADESQKDILNNQTKINLDEVINEEWHSQSEKTVDRSSIIDKYQNAIIWTIILIAFLIIGYFVFKRYKKLGN